MFYYFVRPRKDSKYWNRKPLTPGVHWMSFFLHPGKTWNLNITGVKRKITFQSSLLGSMLISGVSRGQLRHGQRWKIRQSMICGFFQPALSLSFKALAWVLNSPTFETLWHKHSESRSSSKKNTSFTAAFTSSPKSWLQKVFLLFLNVELNYMLASHHASILYKMQSTKCIVWASSGPHTNGHTLSGRNGRPWKHQQKQPENVPTIPFGSQYWYCNTSCVNLEMKKWIGKLLTALNKFPSSDEHHSLRVRLLPLKSKHWRGDRKTTSRLSWQT